MKNITKLIICTNILLLFFSCSKWKVNEIKPKLLFNIPAIDKNENKIRDELILSLLIDYELLPGEIQSINKNEIKTFKTTTSEYMLVVSARFFKKLLKVHQDTIWLFKKYFKIRKNIDNKSNLKEKVLFLNDRFKPLSKKYITGLLETHKKNKDFQNFGAVSLNFSRNDILNITFSIQVYREKIYLVDNVLKRLQVFNNNGKLELVIGNEKYTKSSEIKKKKFKFSVIGKIISDSEGNIFIQNRLIPTDRNTEKNSTLDISPSYLLVFNQIGELQYTLGQRGTTDLPFYYIEKLFIDNKDRLFVISKTFGTWDIYRFSNKKRDLFAKLSKDMFIEKDGENEYTGEIENIQIFNSGERLLLSVAYYHKTRFKYRKIIEYLIPEKQIAKTILDIPEPRNELFNLLDDKYILLWDVEEKDIKFVVKNFQGNIINNIRIKLNANNDYFEQILLNEKGKFYTYRVVKQKGIEIREWE